MQRATSAVVTAFFLGRLSDEIGRRTAILIAIGASLLSTVLFVFADSIPLLCSARIMSGFAIPLAAGAGTAWVAELCENRCTGASLTAVFTLTGLGLGPFLAGVLAQFTQEPLTLPFLALMVLALAAAVITLRVPETIRRVRKLRDRGSLQLVNELAPDTHRAEAVSTFLMFCYLGVSLPVVGIALLSAATTPIISETIFAAMIAAFALFAISTDLRLRRLYPPQ